MDTNIHRKVIKPSKQKTTSKNKEKKLPKDKPPEIIGSAYKELIKIVKNYAHNKEVKQPLLFAGESGSGKEMFAKLYMYECGRSKKITINCASIPDTLISSEVFGYKKGSHNTAFEDKKGLIEAYQGGVIFFDELDKSSKEFQASILRITEGNSFRPIGSNSDVKDFDVLIIAATSHLEEINWELKKRFQVIPVPPLQLFAMSANGGCAFLTNRYYSNKFNRLS